MRIKFSFCQAEHADRGVVALGVKGQRQFDGVASKHGTEPTRLQALAVQLRPDALKTNMARSSSGSGYWPLTPETWVRLPHGSLQVGWCPIGFHKAGQPGSKPGPAFAMFVLSLDG